MSIGKKIALGFGLSLVVLLAVALVAFLGARQLRTTTALLVDSRDQGRLMRAIRALIVDAETSQRGFIITGDTTYLEPYRQALAELDMELANLRQHLADDSEQRVRLEKLEPLVRERISTLENTRRLREQPNGVEAVNQMVRTSAGRGRQLMNQVREGFDEMVIAEDARWDRLDKEARDSVRLSMLVLGGGTLLGLLIVVLGSYLITQSITVPLSKLVQGTVLLGRGQLAHRIDVVNSDETGELATAFNAMAERRQEAEALLAKQAQEREHTLRTVAEFVNQLAGTTSEILVSTTEQVAGAQEQGSAVAQTVSTIEELAQSSDEAAGRARAVSDSARHSEEVGRGGRRAVDEAIASMNAVREQVESIASRILALAEQAQAIGDIITTVNDISEQTHMLALNASIEASRAGEHGRGFAVVAAEVKALADQSKKATAQVRQILGQIQKATQGAVMTTEEGTKSVSTATRVVTQTGGTIQMLSDLLSQASLTAAQISASANQQATGIGQIRQAMRDVSQATQQTLTSTRQTEQAMQDLNAMGQKLKGLLREYGRGL
ncbi:methyl-accepting chemotaxis protein [Melittangium boletus]|uniref:Type IV pilus biogenesis protein PilJ n=1 Tax=Melittangium boletus DSM 14713 TaxID=1294270 RepID=A0A250IRW4_9BACT|nr:methyl-accepting chemotaxis protein [Melittangium boletus]ATB33927.1 type IV pilus biogenesis protein PilJ [Melittangium boletus DSM 14713]